MVLALKSRKSNELEHSSRLAIRSRQIAIAGILISLILASLLGTFILFYHNKLIAKQNHLPKHKLHYEINSFPTSTKYLNAYASIFEATTTTTLKSYPPLLVNATVLNLIKLGSHKYKKNFMGASTSMSSLNTQNFSIKNNNKNKPFLSKANNLTSSTQLIKYVDKLSILIDHDLLKNLAIKFIKLNNSMA